MHGRTAQLRPDRNAAVRCQPFDEEDILRPVLTLPRQHLEARLDALAALDTSAYVIWTIFVFALLAIASVKGMHDVLHVPYWLAAPVAIGASALLVLAGLDGVIGQKYAELQLPPEKLDECSDAFADIRCLDVHRRAVAKGPHRPARAPHGDSGSARKDMKASVTATTTESSSAVTTHTHLRDSSVSTAGFDSVAVALLHGFGANLWSWHRVQARLATELAGTFGSCVITSHDQPGLGITSRLAASGTSADFTLATNGRIAAENLENAVLAAGHDTRDAMHVWVGHSIGCASLMMEIARTSSRVDAIVLEDPVVLGLLARATPKTRQQGELVVSGLDESGKPQNVPLTVPGGTPEALTAQTPAVSTELRVSGLLKPTLAIVTPAGQVRLLQTITATKLAESRLQLQAVNVAAALVDSPLRVAARTAIRLLTAEGAFWREALGLTYGDKSKLTSDMVFFYRLPTLRVGFEDDLISFVVARIKDVLATLFGIGTPNGKPRNVLSEFKAVVWKRSIPVLIVQGGKDRIAPAPQATALRDYLNAPDAHSRSPISGARPHVVMETNPDTGHTTSKEDPAWFVDQLKQFIDKL